MAQWALAPEASLSSIPTLPVFCYGSLLCPEVLEAVLGRVPQSRVARLDGYRRLAIRGRCYPAVRASAGDSVQGRLLEGLSPGEGALLDRFEDPAYDRAAVGVWVVGQTEPVTARVYARPIGACDDLDGSWELSTFRASAAFAPYVQACRRFAAQQRKDTRG